MWLRPSGVLPFVHPQLGLLPTVYPPREGRVAASAGRIPRPWTRATGLQSGSPPGPGGLSDPCGHVLGAPRTPFWPLILGGAKWAKNGRFLPPCGAKSWGSGGAPPTNLILLRNQFPG